jgi:hypothetical protein
MVHRLFQHSNTDDAFIPTTRTHGPSQLGVAVVDAWKAMEGPSDNRGDYLSDGLHLNARYKNLLIGCGVCFFFACLSWCGTSFLILSPAVTSSHVEYCVVLTRDLLVR